MRTGRAMRRPGRGATVLPTGKIPGMVMISERPAEAADRAVPGHWEGDLIVGASHNSVIGTLVERSTRYVMLLHLPDGGNAAAVRDALITTLGTLPTELPPPRGARWVGRRHACMIDARRGCVICPRKAGR